MAESWLHFFSRLFAPVRDVYGEDGEGKATVEARHR